MIGGVQKRLSLKPLILYCPVVKWATVVLVMILQCFLGFQSPSIDFTNNFAQANIPSGYPFLIELVRDFNSDGVQGDVILISNKILYGQA